MSLNHSDDDSSAIKNSLFRPQFKIMDLSASASSIHSRRRSLHHLPVEILACILNILFPEPGGTYGPRLESDMRTIYHLRMVSKSWKDLIEGIPTLWTYVSTSYPLAVVRDCLRWSKNHLLRIFILHLSAGYDEAPFERLQILQPHSHRWKTLYYFIGSRPDMDETHARTFLESPAPMLESIDVSLNAFTSGVAVNLAGGKAEGLKHLTLHGGLLPWSSNFLRGLETLSFILQGKVPEEEISSLFVKNPALICFTLYCEGADAQSTPTVLTTQSSDTVATSLKQVVIRVVYPQIITHILSQISMPICDSIELSADFAELDGNLHTLDGALAQFMPRIRETLSRCGRTTLEVSPYDSFHWSSPWENEGFHFSFGISGTSLERLIEWIRDLGAVSEAPIELEINLRTPDRETVETLGGWNEVTKLTIEWLDPECHEMWEVVSVLEFLGDVLVDSTGGRSWSFPNLRELDVRDAEFELSAILDMLNQRYPPDSYTRAMKGCGISTQVPPTIDLCVENTTEVGVGTMMMALEKHRGVKSLSLGELVESQFANE